MATSLKMSGCMKIVSGMSEDDQNALLERLDHYIAKGIPPEKAQTMAAKDMLAEIRAEKQEFIGHLKGQYPDLFRAPVKAEKLPGEEYTPDMETKFSTRRETEPLPDAIIANPLGAAEGDDYKAGKAGDVDAGFRLATRLITPELLEAIKAKAPKDSIVVGVTSIEETGKNSIPQSAAEIIAHKLGLESTPDIVQSNTPKRTSLGGLDRLFKSPEFDGPVERGRSYVLVDDTLTQGGTFAALASHIEQGGGKVAAIVALTGKQYSSKLAPDEALLKRVRDLHGDIEPEFKSATGYGFNGLTASEARYLANFRPAESVRSRILEESRQAAERPDSSAPEKDSVSHPEDDETPPTGGVSNSGAEFSSPRDEGATRRTDEIDAGARSRAIDRAISEEAGMDIPPIRRESTLLKLRKEINALHEGRSTPEKFVAQAEGLYDRLMEKKSAKDYEIRQRARGDLWLRQKILGAVRDGAIGEREADMAEWLIKQNPALVEDLGIAVKTPKEGSPAGNYDQLRRVATLFSEKTNADGTTAAHEILHHTERLMPDDIQAAIRKEWFEGVSRKLADKDITPDQRKYLQLTLESLANPMKQKAALDVLQNGDAGGRDQYQYLNASEFWAVNGARLLARRFDAANGGIWAKAHTWLKEFVEKAKGFFGMRSDVPVLKALDQLLSEKKGGAIETSKLMLGQGSYNAQREDSRDEAPPEHIGRLRTSMNAARDSVRDFVSESFREIGLFANPMGTGGNMDAMAAAKKFANSMRKAEYQWVTLQDTLTKHFTPDQLNRMWQAADEENEIRSGRLAGAPDRGIDSLPPEQRGAVELLHSYANELLQRAKDVGMFQGEGLPYWTPRMAVMIGDNGEFAPFEFGAPGGGADARNLRMSSPNLKKRKYDTVEEYQAAIQRAAEAAGHDGAEVVADIRTVPFALGRLEKAIAGRELIESVKQYGQLTGQELVHDRSGDRNFFTLDHPAFRTYTPETKKMEDGSWSVATHDDGSPVMKSSPLYIDKSWEGPLRSVLDTRLPMEKLYKGIMAAKAESMNFIMVSPLTHQMVIFGRAAAHGIPVVSALQAYRIGHKAENDMALINEMLDHGMVPLGHKGFLQDAFGVTQADSIKPGNSLIAKGLGGAVGLVSKSAGESVKKGIDWAGDKWHNTLLWNRIADLQRGIYIQVKAAAMKDGHNADVAAHLAADAANKFAGAVPNEAVSKGARAIMNLAFFSRTFQQANLGMVKDMFNGLITVPGLGKHDAAKALPAGTRAIITQLYGDVVAKSAGSFHRKEMWGAFIKDLGMAWVMNNVLQATFANIFKSDDDGDWKDKAAKAYAQRYHEMLMRGQQDWTNWINPYFVPNSLSLLSANEDKHQNRIRLGSEDDGTATYIRNPSGKIPEELESWGRHPLNTMWTKTSPLVKGAIQAAINDKDGYGTAIYKSSDNWLAQLYAGVGHIMAAQIPGDAIKAHWNILTGDQSKEDRTMPAFLNTTEKQKVFGMWSGLSVSHGAPSGPLVGEMYAIDDAHKQSLSIVRGEVKDLVKHGKDDQAFDLLVKAGATPQEANHKIDSMENPERRNRGLKKTMKFADEVEQERLENLR